MMEGVDLFSSIFGWGIFLNCWFNFNGHLDWMMAGDRSTAVDYLEICVRCV
jgi:hypothetical protein